MKKEYLEAGKIITEQVKEKKEKKKISVFNILLLFMIALVIWSLICFTYFVYKSSTYEGEYPKDEQSYYSEITENILN